MIFTISLGLIFFSSSSSLRHDDDNQVLFCVSSDGINNYFRFNIKLSLSLSSVDCCYFVRKESKRRGLLSRKFVRWKMQMRLFYFLLFREMNKWSERSRVQCEVFHLSTLLRLFISCECR